MKKTVKIAFISIGGGLLFALVGVTMLLFQAGIEGLLIALPITIISIGCIIAANGLILLAGRLMARKGSTFAKEIADGDKEIDILEGDERNVAISRRAAATTFICTGWMNSALLIFLIVMQVQLVITLVFLAALIAKAIVLVFLRLKYNKEM